MVRFATPKMLSESASMDQFLPMMWNAVGASTTFNMTYESYEYDEVLGQFDSSSD